MGSRFYSYRCAECGQPMNDLGGIHLEIWDDKDRDEMYCKNCAREYRWLNKVSKGEEMLCHECKKKTIWELKENKIYCEECGNEREITISDLDDFKEKVE